MKNVLVTGAAGFIGHHMVKKLMIENPWCESVFTTDRIQPLNYGISMDLVVDLNAINHSQVGKLETGHFTKLFYDTIFHFAAVSRTVPAMEDPYECLNTNVMGSVRMLEIARRIDKYRGKPGSVRVVLSSSNVVYAADTPYKASKLAMEEAAKAYHETYGVSVVCLRYSNVYGPEIKEGDPACLAALRDSYLEKGYMTLTGDGRQTRDFTHVEDIIRGNLLAAESDYCGTVDLCTGENTEMFTAASLLVTNSPVGVQGRAPGLREGNGKKMVELVPDRPGDVKHIHQDPGPAKEILGWESTIRFYDGVKSVWTY